MSAASGYMTSLDTLLWESALDHAPAISLREAIERAYSDRAPDQLTVWTLSTDLPGLLERLILSGSSVGGIVEYLGAAQLLWVPDGRGAFVAGLWPTSHEGIYHLVGTVPVTDPRWRRLERQVNHEAPRVFVPFLTETEFDEILWSLGNLGEVEVSRLTARTIDYYSSIVRGWRADRVRPSPMQALATIREGGASPRAITVEVVGRLGMSLRRDCGASFYSGSFEAFEGIVMRAFERAAHSRRGLLSGRYREDAHAPLRPISVQLANEAFNDRDVVKELVEAFSRSGASVAVLHRNPYIHMAVTNYSDGSNVDAFIFTGNEMLFYPGYAASAGALARLTAIVTARFAAVNVIEAPSLPLPTREDLLTSG